MKSRFLKRAWRWLLNEKDPPVVTPAPKPKSRPRKKVVKKSVPKEPEPMKPVVRSMELWSVEPGKCRPLPDGWAPPDGCEYLDYLPILSLTYSMPGGANPVSLYDMEMISLQACFDGKQWMMDLRGRFTHRQRITYKNMGSDRFITEDLNACVKKFISRLPKGGGKDLRCVNCFERGFSKTRIIPAPIIQTEKHRILPEQGCAQGIGAESRSDCPTKEDVTRAEPGRESASDAPKEQ